MSDDEYEEESVVVLMDFGTDMSSDALLHAAQTKAEAVFLGLGGNDETYFQLGESDTFAGRIEEAVGTSLLFELQEQKKEPSSKGDAGGGGVRIPAVSKVQPEEESTAQRQNRLHANYVCSVRHIGQFDRIALREKSKDHPTFLQDKSAEELEQEHDRTLQELYPSTGGSLNK